MKVVYNTTSCINDVSRYEIEGDFLKLYVKFDNGEEWKLPDIRLDKVIDLFDDNNNRIQIREVSDN